MTTDKSSPLVKGIAVLVVLVLAARWATSNWTRTRPHPRRPRPVRQRRDRRRPPLEAAPEKPAPKKATPENQAPPATRTCIVRGPGGTIDIASTLERIERGEKYPHRNDGSVFQNRERRLPTQRRGYYREYVHPTPGRRGPGAQRVVIGEQEEIFYTPDHYKSFQRVSWTLERKQ